MLKDGRLRVVTYNVHKCIGLDRRERPGRIAAVLREVDADVVALQEVVSVESDSSREAHQARYIAEELGCRFHLGENRKHRGGAYGNVVLSGEYRGHDGVREFFRDWAASFEGYYAHAEEFTDAGRGQVLVRARQGGRGKDSGVELDMRYWQVFHLQGGRIFRVEVYSDEREALEAVGLQE